MLSSSCCAITISAFPIINKQSHRQTMCCSSASSIHYDSLRVLEWDKLCDLVASFATTSLGRQALKVLFLFLSVFLSLLLLSHHPMLWVFTEQDQLWSLNQSYDESLRLLNETNAAVEMNNHGSCRLHFGHVDAMLVSIYIYINKCPSPHSLSINVQYDKIHWSTTWMMEVLREMVHERS